MSHAETCRTPSPSPYYSRSQSPIPTHIESSGLWQASHCRSSHTLPCRVPASLSFGADSPHTPYAEGRPRPHPVGQADFPHQNSHAPPRLLQLPRKTLHLSRRFALHLPSHPQLPGARSQRHKPLLPSAQGNAKLSRFRRISRRLSPGPSTEQILSLYCKASQSEPD